MMKSKNKVISLVIGIVIGLSLSVSASTVYYNFKKPSYDTYINDRLLSKNSDLLFNYKGRTYIGLRESQELLGGFNVKWDSKAHSAQFYSNEYLRCRELGEID